MPRAKQPRCPSAVGSGAVHEKHRSALAEIIAKLNQRFGDKYSSGALDATVGNIVAKLAVDDHLLQQAEANTPHQFADSPALPKAFNQAMIDVRQETPQIVDDIFGDSDLHSLLSKALPGMLYEYLKDRRSYNLAYGKENFSV